MSRERYDDEDEDDRPRRRRRREDEDEEEDRPRRRRREREPEPKSNAGLIIGIIAGVVLLVLVGCGVGGFLMVKNLGNKFKDEMAADDANDAAMQFFRDLRTGAKQQAYSQNTTVSFRNRYNQAAFDDLLNKNPMLTKHNDVSEQGFNPKATGVKGSRLFTETYTLTVDDIDLDVDEDGNPIVKPKKPVDKKLAPITVKVVMEEGPENVWKVDIFIVTP
jgi:hypothetical protein